MNRKLNLPKPYSLSKSEIPVVHNGCIKPPAQTPSFSSDATDIKIPTINLQMKQKLNLPKPYSLSKSEIPVVHDGCIKPPAQTPSFISDATDINIPIIDLQGLYGDDDALRACRLGQVSEACRYWGFFQIVNHGVPTDLMDRTREVWREFFRLPMEIKQAHANSRRTYEGDGSRLGVEEGAIHDSIHYYYIDYLPLPLKDSNKWPGLPTYAREVIDEYGMELVKLYGSLMKLWWVNSGLPADFLQNEFGSHNIRAYLWLNFYPSCPRPDLTLGLASHSGRRGMTLLLPDHEVAGVQVHKDNMPITVKPAPHAFIVNIRDQIQVKPDMYSTLLEKDKMSSNMNVSVAAGVGVGDRFACADHGNREICSKCIDKGLISVDELFQKTLSKSDTSHKFYIPRSYEEIFTSPDFGFPSITNGEETTVDVTFYDAKETKPWEVTFARSGGSNPRYHLFKWSKFVREKKLSEGDVIQFYKLVTKRGTFLMIEVKKNGFLFGVDITKV